MTLLFSYSATAQEIKSKKPKLFNAWIELNNGAAVPKGIIYEVGDSSLFLKSSPWDTISTEYKYNNIEYLKIRRNTAIARGAIAGTSIGAVTGIIFVNSLDVDFGFLSGAFSTLAAMYFAAIGGGCGVLAATIKDRIPVNSSYANFDKYRGNLLDYSYINEDVPAIHRFEHRLNAGTEIGYSRAREEFAENVPITDYPGMVLTGFSFRLTAGYRFNRILGMNFSMTDVTFDVNTDIETSTWTFDEFLLSPVISLPVTSKSRIDFAPGVGYAATQLWYIDDYILNGHGFGWQLKGAVVYDYSKRWFASAGLSYLNSQVKYKEGGSGNAAVTNFEMGLAYKFGKKGLR